MHLKFIKINSHSKVADYKITQNRPYLGKKIIKIKEETHYTQDGLYTCV